MAAWQQDPVAATPAAEMRELLDLVLGDLQGDAPIPLLAGWDAGSCEIAVRERDRPWGARWSPDPELESRAEMAVGLADYLQEQFLWESYGAWAQARPACPGHAHPATAAVLNGEAWWTCPTDGGPIAPFGALPLVTR